MTSHAWINDDLVSLHIHVSLGLNVLTNGGRVMHICFSILTIIGSDNGLSPCRHQDIIWTNAGVLLIGPFGTDFSEILIEIHTFSFKNMHLKLSPANWRPFCLCLNVLNYQWKYFLQASLVSAAPLLNSSPPGKNGGHFTQVIFKCIFMNGKMCILIPISLKFVPRGPIDNMSALVQLIAWHQTGEKPLSEPLLTHFIKA